MSNTVLETALINIKNSILTSTVFKLSRYRIKILSMFQNRMGFCFNLEIHKNVILFLADKTQGETILVPGVLRGLSHAHQKFGKLKWSELLEPAIEVCEKGFKIHSALGHAIDKKKDYIMQNKGLR